MIRQFLFLRVFCTVRWLKLSWASGEKLSVGFGFRVYGFGFRVPYLKQLPRFPRTTLTDSWTPPTSNLVRSSRPNSGPGAPSGFLIEEPKE